MDFLEGFRRIIAGDEEATTRVASEAFKYASMAVNPSYQQMFTGALLPWIQRLTGSIQNAWYHPDVHRSCAMPLEGGKCKARAISMCCVCRRNVCLTHSFVCVDGQIVCYGCVGAARKHIDPVVNASPGPEEQRQKPASPPPVTEAELAQAYKILGLTGAESMAEVRKARTQLFRKWHPDRVQSAEKKREHEARYKKIGLAFSVIEKAREKGP